MKKTLFSVFALLLLLLIILIIRTPLITYFAFVPDVLLKEPEQDLYRSQTVWFNSNDGYKLHGLFFPSPQPTKKVVLYLHGNAGTLFNRVDAANELSQQGINVFLIDYRGYGLSDGSISESGFYIDSQSALNWLMVVKGFNVDDITVLGRSIGSVAAMKIAVDNSISSIILISPISNASAMAREMNMSVISPFAFRALDNIQRAKHLQIPLMIIHGDKDIMVPIDQGRHVFDAASLLSDDEKLFITVKGATHHNVQKISGDQYWPQIMTFIQKH